MTYLTLEHVRESNLIEGFHDPSMDDCGLAAYSWLAGVIQPLRAEDLWFLHRVVVARQPDPRWTVTQPGWRGQWRRMNLQIDASRVFEPWQDVPELMTAFLRKLRNWQEHDPRELHVEYEDIHPFADGNGRTGRLLMWWHEAQLGRTPTLIRYAERHDYYRWFSPEGRAEYAEERRGHG